MNRIDRLFAIITLLQSKKRLTARQLAAHFDVSERTIFRDLRAVGEIGVPVFFDPESGYSVGSGFFLPPVSLTVEEANALSLAEPLIVRFADKSVQKHYAAAIAKIRMVLGKAPGESLASARDQTAHFVPDHYAHLMPDGDYLIELQKAVKDQRIVRITYENADGEKSSRELEPIGLIFYSLNWHLIAWCHLRMDYRDFRISRMAHVQVTMQGFRKKDHISLQQYLDDLKINIVENPEHPLT